ncbi:MAG: hypothetical protein ACI9V8_000086 [Urechidicola sp.]
MLKAKQLNKMTAVEIAELEHGHVNDYEALFSDLNNIQLNDV